MGGRRGIRPRLVGRYPRTMWAVSFLFCERTGHGDIAAARAWTKDLSAGFLDSPDVSTDDLLLISYVQLLCGDKARAAVALRRFPKDVSDPVYVSSLAAAADLAGANEVRDAALERFCTDFKTKSPKSSQVLQMVRDALAREKTTVLDSKSVDEVLESIPRPASVTPGPLS